MIKKTLRNLMENKIHALTEASDNLFHFTRTAVYSFLEHNRWFDGTIYLAVPPGESISSRNIKILTSIYSKIELARTFENPIIKYLEKYKNHPNYSKMIYATLKTSAFCFDDQKILYFSNTSLFLNDITELLIPEKIVSSTQNYSVFYNGDASNNVSVLASILETFEHDSFTSTDNLISALNSRFSLFVENLEKSDTYQTSSSFPDIRFNSLKEKLKYIKHIYYEMDMIAKPNYSKINSIWLQKNQVVSNYTGRPTNSGYSQIHTSSYSKTPSLVKENEFNHNHLESISSTESRTACLGVSIIIPAFGAAEYIEACLDSIATQISDVPLEILIGVDNCATTLTKLNQIKGKYPNLTIYYSPVNVGPYVIRNSLTEFCKYENILFFDADDIMKNTLIETVLNNSDFIKPVRFRYFDFKNGDDYLTLHKPYPNTGEGVFFIPLKTFNIIGGFQNWPCGADSEFKVRCNKNNIKSIELTDFLFYRRLHNKSLTQDPATGYRSNLRENIKNKIKNNKDWKIPIQIKKTGLIKI